MFRCKVNLLLLSLISIFITAHLPVWAKETHDAFFENISNMYRLEAYLPAIDKLEGLKDTSFKSEILKARGYQKTKQLRKALVSYQKAYELNPKGSELSKQIKILKGMIKANSEELNLSSNKLKCEYLMKLAKLERDRNPELAYKYFVQAYEYDQQIASNDGGIVYEAVEYYQTRLNNLVMFPRFFFGIFLKIQGKSKQSFLNLQAALKRKDLPDYYKDLAKLFMGREGVIILDKPVKTTFSNPYNSNNDDLNEKTVKDINEEVDEEASDTETVKEVDEEASDTKTVKDIDKKVDDIKRHTNDIVKANILEGLNEDPDNAVLRFKLGELLLNKKQYIESLENLEIISQSLPSSDKDDEHNLELKNLKNQIKKIRSQFDEAGQNYFDSYNSGQGFANDFDRAKILYKALRLKPSLQKNEKLLRKVELLYRNHYRKLLRDKNVKLKPMLELANIYEMSGKNDEASEVCIRALDYVKNPNEEFIVTKKFDYLNRSKEEKLLDTAETSEPTQKKLKEHTGSGNQKIISKERATVDNIIKRARSKLKDAKTDAEKEAVLESLKKKIIEKQKSGDLPRSKKVQKKPKSQGKTMEQYMKEKGL